MKPLEFFEALVVIMRANGGKLPGHLVKDVTKELAASDAVTKTVRAESKVKQLKRKNKLIVQNKMYGTKHKI